MKVPNICWESVVSYKFKLSSACECFGIVMQVDLDKLLEIYIKLNKNNFTAMNFSDTRFTQAFGNVVLVLDLRLAAIE